VKARAKTGGALLDVVVDVLATATKTAARKLIKHRRIAVDGEVQPRPDSPVLAGQLVELLPLPAEVREQAAARAAARTAPRLPFTVLLEDEHLIVVDKPAGLLSIATAKEQQRTLYRMVSDHVKETGGGRIFVVHRLDRDVSGVMVFAKHEAAKRRLQAGWAGAEKIYRAVVEGRPPGKQGTVQGWLRENSFLRVVACRETAPGAQEAVTHYRVVRDDAARPELEVRIETGRKHQIRVHLASLGCPIVGDKVYGTGGRGGGIALHAHALTFEHPFTGRRLTVTSPLPTRVGVPQAAGPADGGKSR
jgi:23S rRNA pseudouridine1911/1915/1917 synthase